MVLYTFVCRHLSSFYHKSGYHQSHHQSGWCPPASTSSTAMNMIDTTLQLPFTECIGDLPHICSHLLKQDVNAIGQAYAAPCSFHGMEGFQNKVSIDNVRCIDIPVFSTLGHKGALPLLEMHEDREHGCVTMTMYRSSLLFSVMIFLTYPSIPLIHIKTSCPFK